MEKIITYKSLYSFTEKIFLAIGCSPEHAALAADVLLQADLRGVDSHGTARLSGYVRLWEVGRVNTQPQIKITYETPSTAVVDGDRGLGLVVAPFAMKVAMEKANNVGTGWVSVKNSNHFGIAGYHAMMALENDMIGIAMTNASALVAPTNSKERMLGTNPIAVAVPADNEPAFVSDMATAAAANGKLEIAQRKGYDIPEGWAQTLDGTPTIQSDILKHQGALLPLGSDEKHGSHKGYCLASVVDIFSAVLSGASYGPWAPPFPAYVPLPTNMPGEGLGHFLGAMRVDAFRPAVEFKKEMDHWISRFREAKPIVPDKKVLIPGDPEREMTAIRMKDGIPINDIVWSDLEDLSTRFHIKLI
ncbi:Ldh family oxidoreductase [Rhizosphaericola mali]|uniref:Ldh family oxidoreductase n=1 Tax=Rhizosphaericola mali TaxID=2545455 RepID=A0A5P2G3R8_9BACT|nr:Ldh family oxidoreductase [Rhizosphaericola mali]QES87733.1 Ldh family oxidoreductase [Rhizosphaericola mali]